MYCIIHKDLIFLCSTKLSPQIWLPFVTIQSYCNIIDHILYAIHPTSSKHLFYSWKFAPLNSLYLFYATILPSGSCPFAPCIYESVFCFVLFVHFVLLLDSTYKWSPVVYVFLCLTYFIKHRSPFQSLPWVFQHPGHHKHPEQALGINWLSQSHVGGRWQSWVNDQSVHSRQLLSIHLRGQLVFPGQGLLASHSFPDSSHQSRKQSPDWDGGRGGGMQNSLQDKTE